MFTKHQYFDSSGLFISLMMSTPLLLLSSIIIVSLLSKHKLLYSTTDNSISNWILLRHIILNFVEFSGKLVLSIYRTYDTSEEIAIWKKSSTDKEEIRMKKNTKWNLMQLYISLKKNICLLWCSKQKKQSWSLQWSTLKIIILNEYKQCQGPQHICSLKYNVRKKVQAIHYSV